jgi:hypothetical protein
MKQNITLSIEKDLLQKAKFLAVQRNSSISQMLSQELEKMVSDADKYEIAKRKALKTLKTGFRMGGKITTSRDELHAR